MATLVQFFIALAWGLLAYWWAWIPDDTNAKVPLFAALIGGFIGLRATMFVYFWIRYGWKSARSMSIDE